MDTASFSRAMRRVLRQDPDVILIGEMRDEETVRTALSAAETGHLVLSTVHTIDASESVNRIIDFFQPHEQGQARAMLAGTLKGVVSQRLVPRPTARAAWPCARSCAMTGRARDMIIDPEQTGRLREVIEEGELLRDADLRSGAARALPGRAGLDGGRAARRHQPARLQAARRRRRSHGDVDGGHPPSPRGIGAASRQPVERADPEVRPVSTFRRTRFGSAPGHAPHSHLTREPTLLARFSS